MKNCTKCGLRCFDSEIICPKCGERLPPKSSRSQGTLSLDQSTSEKEPIQMKHFTPFTLISVFALMFEVFLLMVYAGGRYDASQLSHIPGNAWLISEIVLYILASVSLIFFWNDLTNYRFVPPVILSVLVFIPLIETMIWNAKNDVYVEWYYYLLTVIFEILPYLVILLGAAGILRYRFSFFVPVIITCFLALVAGYSYLTLIPLFMSFSFTSFDTKKETGSDKIKKYWLFSVIFLIILLIVAFILSRSLTF